jgi:SAM-dependent methyltransferase
MAKGNTSAHPFDAWYFATSCGRPYGRDPEWRAFFATIADRIVADIAPKRVLDAGCAMGLLVEALRERGVEAWGIDISEYAIASVHPSVREFCRIGSIAVDLSERFDLIVSIEVLEHMAPDAADAALANIARHADDVLFSSSPADYTEATHVNVKPPEAWAERFARQGLLRDLDFDASFITPWAARFRRRDITIPRLVLEYERAFARADLERRELRAQVLKWDRQVQADAAEAPKLREQLSAVGSQLAAAQTDLAIARDRIFHMERSRFWKLRTLWTSFLGLFSASRRADN